MRAPIINPLRFYRNLPDYSTRFPNMDNVTQRVMYIDGVHPAQWYKEWLHNKAMVLQFEATEEEDTDLTIYKYNETTGVFDEDSTATATDITPIGWTGSPMVKHSLTLTEGTYYITTADGLTSDKFVVVNDARLRKKLIEIVYGNSDNDYGVIFDEQTFRQYFTGQLVIGNPENEISAFESDRGNLVKLQSTPKRIATLNINELHYTYTDHVNLLFSCDSITVNGVTYQNTEPPTIEPIENSDIVNVTVKLVQTSNDYYYA